MELARHPIHLHCWVEEAQPASDIVALRTLELLPPKHTAVHYKNLSRSSSFSLYAQPA